MGTVNWRQFLGGIMGMTHKGKRDLYGEFGYPQEISFFDYYQKYRRQNIARRIINLPVNATWAGGVHFEDETFQAEWKKLVRKSHLLDIIKRADKLAGLGRYSGIVLGFDGDRSLATPVAPGSKRELVYAQAYSEAALQISTLETNVQDPRYGLPRTYKIEGHAINIDGVSGKVVPIKRGQAPEVHWTRVIHIAEDLLENEIIGTPRLEPVYNDLLDMLKISGGTAETFWLTANRGMQADVDKDASLGDSEREELEEELERYMHRLSRIIKTRGVKLESLGSDTPSPREPFEVVLSLISGSTGIPQRILVGSEAGHLASEQDRANWAERVKERRAEYAEPVILDQTIDRLQYAGVLTQTEEMPEYVWQDPFIQSPLEQNQTMAQQARAAINLSRQMEKPEAQILDRDECREILGFEKAKPSQFSDEEEETETENEETETDPEADESDADAENPVEESEEEEEES